VPTECKASQLEFQDLGRRQIVASFDGGRISSDGGLLLLREVATATGLLDRFARCFTDHRDSRLIEHTVAELVAQRVLGLEHLPSRQAVSGVSEVVGALAGREGGQ
jgi:Transposase DDE domain group 1